MTSIYTQLIVSALELSHISIAVQPTEELQLISYLQTETAAVNEIYFTPSSPFFARLSWSLFW